MITLKSKFAPWIYLILGMFLSLTYVLTIIIKKLLVGYNNIPFGVFVILGILIFSWVIIVFGELRTKAVKIEIQDDEISVSSYLGIGFRKDYLISEFEGFNRVRYPTRYGGKYEYLYLIRDGKRVITISQYYHRNYFDLKNSLKDKVPDLGWRKVNLWKGIKDIFV